MNHRYSQRMNDMLMKIFQVGDDWRNNMHEYDTFEAACIDKYNVAHGKTDGQAAWNDVRKRINIDQKKRR